VLVADESRARLFASDLMLRELVPLEGRVHPSSRLHARDLVAGARGASREAATGVHTRFERHTDPHRAAYESFARELAQVLERGRRQGSYGRLVIVAPPAMLGALRHALDEGTRALVIASLASAWTTLSDAELAERVRRDITSQPILQLAEP